MILYGMCENMEGENSRNMSLAGNVERIVAMRVLVRKSEGKRPLEKPTCRWEYNIKMDI